jgi:hypothetical protein
MINKVMTNSMNDMPLHRIFSDVVHGVEKMKMAVMTIIDDDDDDDDSDGIVMG